MIQAFLVTLYGLVLAVLCLIPAVKLAGRAESLGTPATAPAGEDIARPRAALGLTVERVAAYIAFTALLVLTAVPQVRGYAQGGPVPIGKVMLHWPAILVVFGGAVALALFMGAGAGARAWTLGFAMTGIISLLTGLIQALFGFVHRDVAEIAAALSFIVSGSSFSLLGLVAVASPLEDREVMEGRREGAGPISRMFWVLLPLLTFIFLVLTFIMVVTPMQKQG
ncbi:MAG TPA: hypothetical protein ENO03_08040 [Candidatus Aminicenantes bacterium]|nr:hypothetical protein [Candidatus Aminicenantes bacterium]